MNDAAVPLTFRAAAANDVAAVVALVESAYRGEASRAGWTTEADLLTGQRTDAAAVSRMVTAPNGTVLLAERAGALAACCNLTRFDEHAYFGMFAVEPRSQRSGIGKAIIAEAERLARTDWNVDALHMTVLAQRPELIAWYQRRGYRRTGTFTPFPYGDPRFGVPLRPDLKFETLIKQWDR